MESSYSLDSNHDLHIINGQIARVTKSDAILQSVKTRLLLVYQEWFLDLSRGLPWFTQMLGHRFDLWKIRSYVARQILSTDGVDELISLQIDLNREQRKLEIEFEYRDDYGSVIAGSL